MNRTEIVKINDVQIECPWKDGQHYVAIRPICQALGIDHKGQQDRLKSSPALVSTGGTIVPSVAADGKQRGMYCIPLRFVFGWLFSIDENLVKEEARESLIRYKMECYNVLYDHFYLRIRMYEQKERSLADQREIIAELEQKKRETDGKLKDAKFAYNEILEKPVTEFVQMKLFEN